MWLVGNKLLKGKYDNQVFIIAAILTSLREPIEQMPSGSNLFIVYALTTGFLMNLVQAFYFRKAGFLASLFVRLGHYLIWHILLGILYSMWNWPGNSRESGVGGRESGVGSRESGVGSRESGVGSRESGVGSRESGVGSRESGVGSRESGVGSRESETANTIF